MRLNYIPYGTLCICSLTLFYSIYIAFSVTGNFLGTVKIVQLESYGGLTFAHLSNFELWRLFTSQLIHAKQIHMLYNVASLALLGVFLERYLNTDKFILLWFVVGSIGTLASIMFIDPPWNIGTGASQAVVGIAAFGLVLWLKRIYVSKGFMAVLLFTLLPAYTLDLIYVGYPKIGHLTGSLAGVIAAVIYVKNIIK